MLDAFIIDRIRREQDRARRRDQRAPLHIEPPGPAGEPPGGSGPGPERRENDNEERGSVVIDFRV